jgi:beta-aspartyl-dipeptidase (metallo-type)
MLTLIRNVDVYAPAPLGRQDILLAGDRIARIGRSLDIPHDLAEVLDGSGLLALPGFIDGHIHITGGGGEGGFPTRTPELMLSEAIRGGVTSLVGCLGTDGHTRTLPGLLAKARGLEEEGLSTWILTGSYGVPVRTFTGSIEEDLLLLDKVIGVGEVAISDHRSSQPTWQELARIAAEAHRGGMLSGKAGIVNLHVGDGPRRLELLERVLEETELTPNHFLPTHMNRNAELFEVGLAYARRGGFVDFTTSSAPAFQEEGEVKCSTGLRRMLEAGVEPAHITFTSDGQGSMPRFDGEGALIGHGVGSLLSLFAEVRDAVLEEDLDLETALQVITTSPARLLGLRHKGEVAVGKDADLVLVDGDTLEIDTVIARGRLLMRDGDLRARGTFEASAS